MLLAFALQVDIAGSLYYFNLSINTVTAVLLVLVIGLSVDYAAHIAHAFMRATGSRKGMVGCLLTFNLFPSKSLFGALHISVSIIGLTMSVLDCTYVMNP